ncbi:Ubiquitin-like protein ATG12 [Yarrowia sp. C11]|nr:Ubiquitin-like protein ATG12 [Yarrowia sp. E02]KAG5371365.1 Ubiquitin-like protein ATG12 [Yarrowia sp. C11]
MIESDSDTSDEAPQEYVSASANIPAPFELATAQMEATPEPHLTQQYEPEALHKDDPLAVPNDSPAAPTATDSDTIDSTPPPVAPATLSASAVLPSLPSDTAAILETFSQQLQQSNVKCQLKFRPIGGATPTLKQSVYKIAETQQFGVVVKFLRKQLRIKNSQSSQIFCYISSFAPGLDETVGSLYNRYAIRGELTISYCLNQAFG